MTSKETTSSNSDNNWRVWDSDHAYGDVLFKRATGQLPEMESSKSVARQLEKEILKGDRILDVGCGSGHYLTSLRRTVTAHFEYVGIDATQHYIELAKKAYSNDSNASFLVGDIYDLPYEDKTFDVVLCCNLLLHLPSVKKAIHELCRVSKRFVLVRSLIGERSFRIKEIRSQKDLPDFDDSGEPTSFNYYNIYSAEYMKSITPPFASVQIEEDTDFNPAMINQGVKDQPSFNVTRMSGDWQVNGYIMQPWAFMKIRIS